MHYWPKSWAYVRVEDERQTSSNFEGLLPGRGGTFGVLLETVAALSRFPYT